MRTIVLMATVASTIVGGGSVRCPVGTTRCRNNCVRSTRRVSWNSERVVFAANLVGGDGDAAP
jgi:hypothetical protein